jgi:hypothetical protein
MNETKITEDQLTAVKELQSEINNSLLNIGNLELIKAQLMTKQIELQQDWKTLTESLEKEYGSVNININDGTISKLEEKPEEVPL